MNLLGMITFLLLIIAVDYFYFDRDRKRWGLLKGASRAKKPFAYPLPFSFLS
ncbi:hypothetical protein P4U90_16260 [Cytobacillus kochii]|uniref:hypothetical protein n=1 Tax=Cytobacillus kochii TaxID=859143 RepID=UPI002E2261DD|nr:hypothetical protein [Cytobacillus kochii]